MRGPVIEGKKYGLLTYKAHVSQGHNPMGLFVCDCGKECIYQKASVKAGKVVSCGCQRRRNAAMLYKAKEVFKKPSGSYVALQWGGYV